MDPRLVHASTLPLFYILKLFTKKLVRNWPQGCIIMVRFYFTSPPGIISITQAQWYSGSQVYTAWLPFFNPRVAVCHMLLQARAAFIVGCGESNRTNVRDWLFVTRSADFVFHFCFCFFLLQI